EKASPPKRSDLRDFTPLTERASGKHSERMLTLAGIGGEKDLSGTHVLELGSGSLDAFHFRAESVAQRNGHYSALDIDRTTIAQTQSELQRRVSAGETDLRNIDVIAGNAYELQGNFLGNQDVVIINRISGGATPQECLNMYAQLQQLQATQPNPSLERALAFLGQFNKRFPDDADMTKMIEGPNGKALALLTAFLALKNGGRLVFAHNDKNMMQLNTQRIEDILEDIGFTNIQREDRSVRQAITNVTELPHVLMTKLAGGDIEYSDYAVTKVVADKPIGTSGASQAKQG
ncbi:MAG TPA: hypothetical protein VEW42_02305, partial [Candidatus Eisenbacteria bacterium]|nr:hypothetical protein [Candidatus Eisenbacteria bacterium]